MRIVLDAMGGDYIPQVPVAGAVEAARAFGDEILLVGPEPEIQAELARHDAAGLPLQLVHAPEVIAMDEHAAMAVRRKKDSSISVGMRLVRDGQADAFVSAGHSGAVMAAAILILGRLPGVHRSPLATIFPNSKGWHVLTDIGANTDCRPEYLVQFAYMGAAFAEKVHGLTRPRVALLANGEEDTKGDRLVQEAHALLRQETELNFIGNVEPKEMLAGAADVVVADGFVGNMMIKGTEAVAELILGLMREEFTRTLSTKIKAALLRPALRRVKRRLDYSEYGGGLLLGLKGVVIIGHGRSNAAAIRNAIRLAREAVEQGTVPAIAQSLKPADRESEPATPEP